MENLIIDPEFRDKIPPMPIEDFNGLRDDILRDGYVRDPLTVWKEENILLDGHHRWRIIQENPEVLDNKYKIDYRSFPDRFACIAWICANQLHKHNMTETQRDYLYKEEYFARQKSVGAPIGNANAKKQCEQNVHIEQNLVDGSNIVFQYRNGKEPRTRTIMAREHGVNEGVIQRAVEVGKGIDRAEEVVPGIKNEILSGSLKAKKKDLADIRKLKDDEEVKKKISEIRNPPVKNNKSKEDREADRKRLEMIQQFSERQRDKEYHSEYTIEMLADEIERIGQTCLDSLRNLLTIRSTLLDVNNPENRKIAFDAVEKVIQKINHTKELLQ